MPDDLGDYGALPTLEHADASLGDYAAIPPVKASPTPETDKAVAATAAAASRMPDTGQEESALAYIRRTGQQPSPEEAPGFDQPLIPAQYLPPYLIGDLATKVFPDSKVAKLYSGEMKGVADVISGFTSPENLSYLSLAGLGSLAGRLVGGAFAVQAATHVPEQYQQFQDSIAKGDYEGATRTAVNAIGSVGLPALMAAHPVGSEGHAKAVGEINKTIQSERMPAPQEPVGITETLAELKKRNIVTPGEVILPEKENERVETQRPRQENPPAIESPLASTAESAAGSVPESASAAEPLTRSTLSGPELNPNFSLDDRVPDATGISDERLQQIYGEDAITVGKGRGAKEWQKIGQSDQRDPYAVLSAARARGIASPKDVALLRAEHQRLLGAARTAYGSPEYSTLAQNSANMANAIKEVAHGPASDVFRALQDTDIPRYDSPAYFDSIVRERMNRESTPEEHGTFNKIASELRNGDREVIKSASDAQNRLSKYQPRESVSFEDAVKHIKDQIESLTTECNL